MSWQDEQDAGLNQGVPKWVWIVGVVVVLMIVGAIMKSGGGGNGKGSGKTATLDGYDPASKTTIDPINGFDSAGGITRVCSYSSGQTVKVLDSSGGRTKVDGGGCVGWLSSDFVK